ncbi:unnamed protein product [Fusarium graminearum]|uniref:Uncharacterized protein n=1 Tax=Gibberella zeae TaxID=5518 RepID=A0A4E9DG09_GIBZA|nr:unnamed protein product [Fusarium graminearum]CAF3558669.1 unnamed protein product [Fusarium graminearum]CAG1980645.1 unnamed protein product [Fusarium graminearum]CAG1999195.1 unnamed protein product [Fusarium graminearum]
MVLGYFVAFVAVSFLSILVFAIFVIFTVSLVFWVAFGIVFAGPGGLRPHDTRRHRLRCLGNNTVNAKNDTVGRLPRAFSCKSFICCPCEGLNNPQVRPSELGLAQAIGMATM